MLFSKGSTWREMCASLKPRIRNPYLAAIFSFLMSTSDDYNQVKHHLYLSVMKSFIFLIFFLFRLKSDLSICDRFKVLECPIALQDRLMFACRFLSDLKLYKFVREQTAEYVQQGNLEGLSNFNDLNRPFKCAKYLLMSPGIRKSFPS